MSFIKSFVTKSVFAAASEAPKGLAAIAVFFYGTPPTPEEISALATNATITTETIESKTRITVSWADVNTTITIDSAWNKEEQMVGMRGWVERFPARVRALQGVQDFIATLETVSACYGSVTKPGLDADDKAINLLKALLLKSGGFFFSRNSFYEADGVRITGFDDDPMYLGTPPAQ